MSLKELNFIRLVVIVADMLRTQLKQADGEPTAGQGVAGVKLRYTPSKDNTWFDWAYNKARNGYHRGPIPWLAAKTLGDNGSWNPIVNLLALKQIPGDRVHAYTGAGLRDANPFPIPSGAGGTVNVATNAPRVYGFKNTLLGRLGRYLANDPRLDDFAAGRQQLTNEEGEKHLGMLAYADHVTQNAAKQLPQNTLNDQEYGFRPSYLSLEKGRKDARNEDGTLNRVPTVHLNSDSSNWYGSPGAYTHELVHSLYPGSFYTKNRHIRPFANRMGVGKSLGHEPYPRDASVKDILKSQESENLHNSDMVKLMPADRSLYDNLVPFPVSEYGTKGIQHALSALQNATLFDLGQFANNDPGVHSLHGDVDSTLPSETIDAVNAVPQSKEILRRGHQLLYDPSSLNPSLGLKNTNNRDAHGNPVFE